MNYKKCALVVNYEVEATVLNDLGEVVREDRKTHKKVLRIPNMTRHTDIFALAEDIVSGSKLIHRSKISRVRKLLSKLQEYEVNGERESESDDDEYSNDSRMGPDRTEPAKSPERRTFSMDSIGEYMELLYDENMEEKVNGTNAILQLAKVHENMEDLLRNDPLMSSLSRVLKEDYKKNMDLVLNITSIFFYFSRFSQMHDVLADKGVGSITIKVLELELRRYDMRVDDMKKLEKRYRESESRKDEKRLARERQKTNVFVVSQDKVIIACVQTLLNLAEDLHVERKMVKRNIVELVVRLLDRTNRSIRLVAAIFLMKLSVVSTCKDKMIECDAIRKAVQAMDLKDEKLTLKLVKLLFNLSFDSVARAKLLENAVVPRLITMLRKPTFRAVTIRLLYNLSVEDRCKTMFSYSESGMDILLSLLAKFPKSKLPPELGALAINLTFNARNCEHLVKNGKGLHHVVKRMCKYPQDALLCAVVRNLSQWTFDTQHSSSPRRRRQVESKNRDDEDEDESKDRETSEYVSVWKNYINPILQVAAKADAMPNGHDSLLHIFGILANMTTSDMPSSKTWASFVTKWDVLRLLVGILIGGCEVDIIQTCVMFIGSIALDIDCDPLLCDSKVPRLLVEMLNTKRRDNGLLSQILHTIYRMLRLPRTREELIHSHNVIDSVCDCLKCGNATVVSCANAVINYVMDHGDDDQHRKLWESMQAKRFEIHNREWVDMIEEIDMDEGFIEEGKLYFDDAQSRDEYELDPIDQSTDGVGLSVSATWTSGDEGGMGDADDDESPRTKSK